MQTHTSPPGFEPDPSPLWDALLYHLHYVAMAARAIAESNLKKFGIGRNLNFCGVGVGIEVETSQQP